jgi:hypothetical protein
MQFPPRSSRRARKVCSRRFLCPTTAAQGYFVPEKRFVQSVGYERNYFPGPVMGRPHFSHHTFVAEWFSKVLVEK